MGRIQSSIGLITGTDIAGTVDQLMQISGRPRDRLVGRNESLQEQQKAIGELTAVVVGTQLAGKSLADAGLFRSTKATSSDPDAVSVSGGSQSQPGTHVVRTLQTASTHDVGSLRRDESPTAALGLSGTLSIRGGEGSLDRSLDLSNLNGGRGVEPGVIRISDRTGRSAEIDLSAARTVEDVLASINDADVGVTATTAGDTFRLTDTTGGTASNLRVTQLGAAETAADLGLWGIDVAADTASGFGIELPEGVSSLRGVPLGELNGGAGTGPLTQIDLALADGSSASVDVSAATSTSELIDAINAAGLPVIARLNDARNGLQLRDVSGGSGTFSVGSADGTAAALGIESSTDDGILVGENLNRQTVTAGTLLSELNRGEGIGQGSFTVTDSSGEVGAVNLKVDDVQTVGDLIERINSLGIGVTAALNDAGDGIAVVDTAGGSETLQIADSGNGTAASDLRIAGTATTRTVGGTSVSALVGGQSDTITIDAEDTLESIVAKVNEATPYANAGIRVNDDGTFSLGFQATVGGEGGQFAINTSGFDLDLRTRSLGQDAMLAVSSDGAAERVLRSTDGVFELSEGVATTEPLTAETLLSSLNSGGGVTAGSFTITDRGGAVAAVNLQAEQITTVGGLVDAINGRGIGVEASISEDGSGLAIVDTSGGSGDLTIEDTGKGTAAADLGIAGTGSEQTVEGESVFALVGPRDPGSAPSGELSLTLKELSAEPITVTIAENPDAVLTAAKTFVKQYNTFVEKLESLTFYDAETEQSGLLFGSGETLRVESGYKRLLSGTVRGAGAYRSIGQVGMRFQDDGKLTLDETKLREAMAEQPGAVEAFFATDETGLAARLDQLADRIAGTEGGLLLSRNDALGQRIERNRSRVESMNERLEGERERLLTQFYRMEEAISKVQSNQQFLTDIKPIQVPARSSGS